MSLQTRAEATAYAETSLHADVMAFVAALDARGDRRFHRTNFGASPEGRELPLCVLSAHGVKTPAESKGEWDLYAPVATIPADEAFAPADPKACPLVKE